MILSLANLLARAGLTSTDSTRDAALTALLADVDAAIRRAIRPYLPEPVTVTDAILDAPRGNVLSLPCVPVRSITSLYLRWGANGDASLFDAGDLLAANTDYYLPLEYPEAHSRSGDVYRRGRSSWGYERRWPVGRLAPNLDPARGAVKATFAAGPASVPSDLASAAFFATMLLYDRRERGAPLSSESWGGRSESVAGQFSATSVIESPEVAAMLRPYQTVRIGVA